MSFGIFQDAYNHQASLSGSRRATGVIGTTLNGVMYLSLPILSTVLDNPRWAKWRRTTALVGIAIESAAFLASSWATEVWHLIVLQGVIAALGSAMLFSPTTLFVDEWFRGGNRTTAYGVTLSSKNVVGTSCPLIFYALLQKLGFRWTLRIWAAIVLVTGLFGICILPRTVTTKVDRAPRKIPWTFLQHRTFYIYAIGNIVFSSGYGLPQTYLPQYASNELHLSRIISAVMIVCFNVPGILSCVGMGILSDRYKLAPSTATQISTMGSAVCAFLLWGLRSHRVEALLILFSVGYGFFASAFSTTWGGWLNEMEREAADKGEAINTGMVYGLMNGARGIGYVAGGLAGVELLQAGAVGSSRRWAYGTQYGALILFTGVSAVFGGWASVWKTCSSVKRWRSACM